MIKRIGMLTSGGDCQALNATMRGATIWMNWKFMDLMMDIKD